MTNTFDRLGRAATTICNGMTTTFAYNDASDLLSETFSGGTLNGLAVTNAYDAYLRRTAVGLNTQTATLIQFGYDTGSRLAGVTNGNYNAAYAYLANSPLVSTVTFRTNTTTRMTTTKSYDFLNRLTSISSSNSQLLSPISYTYAYNSANQRTRATLSDGSYWLYEYDSLGQVRSGKKYWSDGSPVAGQQFEYAFDDIGNRTQAKAGGDENGWNLRPANYAANNLNQYTNRDVPGYVDILGLSFATNSVTVNSQTAYRKGEYFRKELAVGNGSASLWTNIIVAATGQASVTGNLFVAKSPEAFAYDADGNLTSDGRWTNRWDGENRLVGMETLSSVPTGGKKALGFGYDARGRRQSLVVSNWSGSAWTNVTAQTRRFVYDGWNLLAALDGNNALVQSFVWGLDLSGSLQGAGGVGGLLGVNDAGNGVYFAAYDGNGNVMALAKGTDGTVSANYEYGPFGEMLRSTGPMAKANVIRFSTKYQDGDTDFLYYGYRSYNPILGRWLSRDPIQEAGGVNLYDLARNEPIAAIDRLGLAPIEGYSLKADPSDPDDPNHFAFYRSAFLLPITYPKDGVKCACQGRFLGFVHGSAWIDLSTSFGLNDRQPDFYNKVVSPWPHWISAYKQIFENPRYVGAGFTAIWNQNNAGQICCKNPVWYNYIVRAVWPDKDDGRFPGIQFVDSPGNLRPPLRSFSRAYKLVLKCEDPGWPAEVIGQWAWGVDIQLGAWSWSGTLYPPTADFAEPWPF